MLLVPMLVTCSRIALAAFPTEQELNATLHVGMPIEEAYKAFGAALRQKLQKDGSLTLLYHASANELTDLREGYAGFELSFLNGTLASWRLLREKPSFRSNAEMPFELKWMLWFYGLCAVALLAFVRFIRWVGRILAHRGILDHYRMRELATNKLPREFRFITHDTTLRQVIDRLGSPSRLMQLVIPEDSPPGFSFVATPSGQPAIVVAEYQVPYHAPVYVMPEYPFEATSQIRAAFQGELKVETLVEPYGGDVATSDKRRPRRSGTSD